MKLTALFTQRWWISSAWSELGHEECQRRWKTTVAARWGSREGGGAGGTQALRALPGEDSAAQCGADAYHGITCLVIVCPSFVHPYCFYTCWFDCAFSLIISPQRHGPWIRFNQTLMIVYQTSTQFEWIFHFWTASICSPHSFDDSSFIWEFDKY